MRKYVGNLRTEERMYTIGQLKEALACYDDDLKLCFVESTGEAIKIESIEFLDADDLDIDTDGLYAPFDFELKEDILYIPVYDGNIVAFINTKTEREE